MRSQNKREALAALEHEQWLDWVAGIIDSLPPERAARMKRLMVPYEELPEVVKDIDRHYADRVIAVVDA